MKKSGYVLAGLAMVLFLSGCADKNFVGMANPWVDCDKDMKCAAQKAGFDFPIEIKNSDIRAMKDMIEVRFKYNGKSVTVRKSVITEFADISGDYNNYRFNERLELPVNPDIYFFTRSNLEGYNVVNFEDFGHDYSINTTSKKGLTKDEIQGIYKLIRAAEEK